MSASLRLKAICGVPVSSENQILRLTYPPHPNETAGGSGSRRKMAEYTHPRMAVTMSRAFPATPPPTPLGGGGQKICEWGAGTAQGRIPRNFFCVAI